MPLNSNGSGEVGANVHPSCPHHRLNSDHQQQPQSQPSKVTIIKNKLNGGGSGYEEHHPLKKLGGKKWNYIPNFMKIEVSNLFSFTSGSASSLNSAMSSGATSSDPTKNCCCLPATNIQDVDEDYLSQKNKLYLEGGRGFWEDLPKMFCLSVCSMMVPVAYSNDFR